MSSTTSEETSSEEDSTPRGPSPQPSRESVSLPNSPEASRRQNKVGLLSRSLSLQYLIHLPDYFSNIMAKGTKERARVKMDLAQQVPEDGKIPSHRAEMDGWPADVIRGETPPRSLNHHSFEHQGVIDDTECSDTK